MIMAPSCGADLITGWYDALLHEGFKVFDGWKSRSRTAECRSLSRMRIGPW